MQASHTGPTTELVQRPGHSLRRGGQVLMLKILNKFVSWTCEQVPVTGFYSDQPTYPLVTKRWALPQTRYFFADTKYNIKYSFRHRNLKSLIFLGKVNIWLAHPTEQCTLVPSVNMKTTRFSAKIDLKCVPKITSTGKMCWLHDCAVFLLLFLSGEQ